MMALGCMLVVGASTSGLAFLVQPALDDIFLRKDFQTLIWVPIAVVFIYAAKGLCSY